MDSRVAADKVIDTTISHNTSSKFLDNVIFNNSYTTRNSSANEVHSQINACMLHRISMIMQLEALMSNNTKNVEHTLVKVSSQIPRTKYLKRFHQNIGGLGNKSNELYCQLHHDLPHIVCLLEHHLSESKLQLIHLNN
jgi:hypothetical protein